MEFVARKSHESEFPRDIRRVGEKYEIKLPWKNKRPVISTNYDMCQNRLKSLYYKLLKEPELLKEYDSIMNDQLEKGIIESVPTEGTEPNNVHFMPYHAVVRQDKETTKLRVVYDGSAKKPQQTHSINDLLKTGPNYIPKLRDVLVKFRSHVVAVTSDIEKAFLMIRVNQVDRDMLRLLWLKDPFVMNSEIIQLHF